MKAEEQAWSLDLKTKRIAKRKLCVWECLISINQLCALSFHGACLVARFFPSFAGKKPILSRSWLQMKAAKMQLPSGMECNEPRIHDSIRQATVMTGSFPCGQQGFNKDHVEKQLPSPSHLQAMLRQQHSTSAGSCWSINRLGSYKCDRWDKCVTSSSAKHVECAGNTRRNTACWSCWDSLGWPTPFYIQSTNSLPNGWDAQFPSQREYAKTSFRIWTARAAAMIAWEESANEAMNRKMVTHGRQLRVLLLFHPPLRPATATHFA